MFKPVVDFPLENLYFSRKYAFTQSPLLVAAERYVSVATEKNSVEITLAEKSKIRKNLAECCAEKTES